MPAAEPPLDETSWSSPQDIAALPGGLHANSVHIYFSLSPYFDRTSNNGVLLSQSLFSPQMFIFRQNRAAFETQLATMHGIQYIVVQEPSPNSPDAAWIIRKQDRSHSSSSDGTMVTVLEHYFILGIMVLQAPRLNDVLSARIATVASGLHNTLSLLSKAVSFSPAKGYTWPAPLERKSQKDGKRLLSSRSATPESTALNADGMETTPAPSSQMTLNLNMSKRVKTKDRYRNPAIWIESFRLAARYAGEDMDSHYLVGEPMNFKIEAMDKGGGDGAPSQGLAQPTATQSTLVSQSQRRSQTPKP